MKPSCDSYASEFPLLQLSGLYAANIKGDGLYAMFSPHGRDTY